MEELEFPITAREMGRALGATVIGDDARIAQRLEPLSSASDGALSFCGSARFAQQAGEVKGAVILTRQEWVRQNGPSTYLVVENPQSEFAKLARRFAPTWADSGVSELASVHPSVRLGRSVSVGAFAVLEAGVEVGDDTHIGSHCVVGAGVRLGNGCRLHPRVTLFPGVRLGDRVQIFPGSVLGADGFGLFAESGGLTQMPQIGTVVVEDDVRIGANCTIDRATFGQTRIGRGAKLDNLVHIAHNCVVKENAILCAQVGVAGSTTLETGVILAGQVGVTHGITVGKNARVAAQSGIAGDLPGDESYLGSPAVPLSESYRNHLYTRRLGEIFKRVKTLETQMQQLQPPSEPQTKELE